MDCAQTTGYVIGRAVQFAGLTGTAGITNLNGLIFTISAISAGVSVTLACPTATGGGSGSGASVPFAAGFTYTPTAGTMTLQPAYGIFSSDDSLSSTCPITMKLEFFVNSTNFSPMCRVSIGTQGSSGYGTLNATATTATVLGSDTSAASDTANLKPCYLSGDAGTFRMSLFQAMGVGTGDGERAMTLVVARSRDNLGNQTSNYVMLWAWSYLVGAAAGTFQTVFSGGTVNAEDTSAVFIAPIGKQSSGAYAGVSYVAPVFQNVGGLSNPTPDLLAAFLGDFPTNVFAQITVYGVNHTYISVNNNNSTGVAVGSATVGNSQLLMRFE